jgi:hypothetical protein
MTSGSNGTGGWELIPLNGYGLQIDNPFAASYGHSGVLKFYNDAIFILGDSVLTKARIQALITASATTTMPFASLIGQPTDNTNLATALSQKADSTNNATRTNLGQWIVIDSTSRNYKLSLKADSTGNATRSFVQSYFFPLPLGTNTDNYIPKYSSATGKFILRPDSVGGGGSLTWGAITGTLSNQTDLNSALAQKADTSGIWRIYGTPTENMVPKWSTAQNAPIWRLDSVGTGGGSTDTTSISRRINAKLDTAQTEKWIDTNGVASSIGGHAWVQNRDTMRLSTYPMTTTNDSLGYLQTKTQAAALLANKIAYADTSQPWFLTRYQDIVMDGAMFLADSTSRNQKLSLKADTTDNATRTFTSTYYAPKASPTFTGTVTIPSPFTVGATSVTTTGAKLNYLTSAAGTTGTTSTNLVFSTSPTLTTPVLGVATMTSMNGLQITTQTTDTLNIANGAALQIQGAYRLFLTQTSRVTDTTASTSGYIPVARFGTSTFSTTNLRAALYIPGTTASDIYVATPISASGTTTPVAGDQLAVYSKTDSLIVQRAAGTTSGLGFNWMRMR